MKIGGIDMIKETDFTIGDVCFYRYVEEEVSHNCLCVVLNIEQDAKKKIKVEFSDLVTSDGLIKDYNYELRFPLDSTDFKDFKILYNTIGTVKEDYPELFI
jgi:hypothetical protein